MIINDEKEFIFICVAKTGSTSIRRMFGSFTDPPPEIYHMSLEKILKQNSCLCNYKKIAFVRNPYDRLYSCYSNFKYDGHYWEKEIKKTKDFQDFVLKLESSNLFNNLIHLRPQFDYLAVNGKIDINFLGRFENFEDDCKKMFEFLNIEFFNILKTRISSKKEPKIYTPAMKEVVYKIYKKDFEIFNYEK